MRRSGITLYRDSSYAKSTLAVSVQLLLPHGIKMVLYIYRSQPVCPTFLAGRYVAGELRWKSYHIRPTYPLYIEMLMLRGVGRLRVVKLALSLLGITVFIDLLLVISEPPRTQNTPQLFYFRRGAHLLRGRQRWRCAKARARAKLTVDHRDHVVS